MIYIDRIISRLYGVGLCFMLTARTFSELFCLVSLVN